MIQPVPFATKHVCAFHPTRFFHIGRKIEELHIVGVCTDICVLHTAVDAYNKGFKIVVHEQGVASFNQAGHEWALGHFTDTLGGKVV